MQKPPVKIFISYTDIDQKLAHQLRAHLSPLIKQELIEIWEFSSIPAGVEIRQYIAQYIQAADIILLLISPDFFSSYYGYEVELPLAMERYRLGLARVIPIILRPADWQESVFGNLLSLPSNGRSVTEWSDRDAAFSSIVRDIRRVCKEMLATPVLTPNNSNISKQNPTLK